MNEIPVGSSATIVGYTIHNAFTERLREFGLIEGTIIKLLRKAPWNGPIEVQYGHSQIVLRPDELTNIQVKRMM